MKTKRSSNFFNNILTSPINAAAATNNGLLQPTATGANLCNNNKKHHTMTLDLANKTNAAAQVGATWSENLKAGNLKIDLDNLLTGKANNCSTPAPSMNALKVQSPTKVQQMPLNVQTPTMGNFVNSSDHASGGISSASGAFFNTISPTINIPTQWPQQPPPPPQQQQAFANFSALNTNPSQTQLKSPHNDNNNLHTQTFDLFQ